MSDDYEERKKLLEDLKRLVKSEQEDIFRILKETHSEYSENSNGVFFDVSKISRESFEKIKKYMEFCIQNRQNFTLREEEERKAQEILGAT